MRGGVSLTGIEEVYECECNHPVLPRGSIFGAFDKDQVTRWEDDALEDLTERY